MQTIALFHIDRAHSLEIQIDTELHAGRITWHTDEVSPDGVHRSLSVSVPVDHATLAHMREAFTTAARLTAPAPAPAPLPE